MTVPAPDPDEAREPPALAAPGGPLAFTLASWFTWTAVGVAFPAFAVLLVPVAGLLAQGVYETFHIFAITHVATLGWATMTAFGALLQIAPVLLGARVRGERSVPWLCTAHPRPGLATRAPCSSPYHPPLGRAVLWLSNAGVAGLVIGIWSGAGPVALGGAVLLAAASPVLAYLLAYRWIPPAAAGALRFEWRWRIS